MSYAKSNANYTVPMAESTQIEDSPRASPSRSKFLWGGNHAARISKMSPGQLHQSLNKSANSPRPRALDAKIYRDTQSNGLASRINKYKEESAAKSRPIANRSYSRPGDFPIVNLEKSEISIKPRQTNGSAIAKIGVGAPLQLSNQATIRSAIFRTGKNYGDTLPIPAANNIGVAGTSGATSNGNGSTSRDDEPIVPTIGEYDANPTRSVLDALVEISRKRTHCDDLDGDFLKKQKADKSPNANAQMIRQPSPPPNQVVKRARDRTSPSYYNSSAETQKKRYRYNDILSSLSSSLHLNASKSVRTNLVIDFDGDKSNASIAHDKNAVKGRPALRSEPVDRNGNHNAPISVRTQKEITPSRSQPPLQREPPKVQKLTLFNKIYEPAPASDDNNADDENYLDKSDEFEDSRISFVKPKTKTSTIFKINRDGSGARDKLKMLLSCLNESDSRDEVDNGAKADKTKANETPIVIAASTASLSNGDKTTVTFSTATTTSVLSLPSAITAPETPKNGPSIAIPVTGVSEAIKSTPVASSADALPKSTPLPTFNEPAKPTISFAMNATTTAPTTIGLNTSTVTSSESVPRLGGFSFGATLTTTSPSIASKPDTNVNNLPVTKQPENPVPTSTSLPSFSFGKPAAPITLLASPATAAPPLDAAKPIPAAGGFSFGASTTPKTTSLNHSFGVIATTATSTLPTTSAQSMATFSFGKPVNQPFNSTTTAPPTAPSTTSSAAPPTFNFGAPKPAGISFGTPTPSVPVATTASLSGNTFSFGATSTAAAPPNASPFGATSNAAPIQFGAKIESTSASTLTTQTPVPNLFGTSATVPKTTASITGFGATNTTFNNTATTTIPSFGASFNQSSAATTTAAPPAFGASTTSFNSTTATPVFGGFGANTNAPAPNLFGSANVAAPQKTEPFVFGSNSAAGAPPPAFGSSSTPVAPTFGSSSTAAAPAFGSSATPAFGTSSFGATNNVFGTSSSMQNSGSAGLFGGNNTNTASNCFASPPAFGATATPSAQPAPASGVFAFGQSAAPTTTASSGGIFGSTSTNTNSAFAFGQTANAPAANPTFAAPTNDTNTPFAFNAGTNTNATAPPAFGNNSSTFSFGAKVASPFGAPVAPTATESKSPFSFNTVPNASATSVSAFNSAPPNVSPFGSNNNVAAAAAPTASFTFGASTNEAAKPFSFGTSTTDNSANNNMFGAAPASTPAPFTFGAPAATGISAPAANAFQFNAQQPPTNLFSIGPGNTSTAPKNRPIRQATRRMNK